MLNERSKRVLRGRDQVRASSLRSSYKLSSIKRMCSQQKNISPKSSKVQNNIDFKKKT